MPRNRNVPVKDKWWSATVWFGRTGHISGLDSIDLTFTASSLQTALGRAARLARKQVPYNSLDRGSVSVERIYRKGQQTNAKRFPNKTV